MVVSAAAPVTDSMTQHVAGPAQSLGMLSPAATAPAGAAPVNQQTPTSPIIVAAKLP